MYKGGCLFVDKKFRKPRVWSNDELKKFARLFEGKIINISGWQDKDKDGAEYKNYFPNKSEYWISNYKSNAKGYQGNLENEIFLDLEQDAPAELINKFDVVFNHTVLEHTFDIFKAFENICGLSKDIIIITVPFFQEQHARYGDYWRFTPSVIKRLFEINGMTLLYINYNDSDDESIYIFAVASRYPMKWETISNNPSNALNKIDYSYIGTKVIKNNIAYRLFNSLRFFF